MFRPMHHATLLSSILVAGIFSPTVMRAQFQNPITAAKDAYKKAKEQQQQQQQQQRTGQAPAGTQPQGSSTNASPAANSASDNAAPWVPPGSAPVTTAATASSTTAAAAAAKIDPSKMPDVVGVRLGMTAPEALAAAHKAYPNDMFVEMKANGWPTNPKPDNGYNIHSRTPGNDKELSLSFTAPPGEQRVWKVDRMTERLHVNRSTLIAALRQKYGKESFAWGNNDDRVRAANDNQIIQMVWLYDEQGNHVPMPDNTVFTQRGEIGECELINGTNEPVMPTTTKLATPWCSVHFVALVINIGSTDIIEYTTTDMVDVPLGIRTGGAAEGWLRDYANRMHQEDLQRSKENTPTL